MCTKKTIQTPGAAKEPILYVDDEKQNLTSFKYIFLKDYKIYLATSAREGLKILEENKIKVVISDQRMPETTGVDFFTNISQKYPMIVRILLTGYTDVDAIIGAINKGRIYRYLSKPWDKQELKLTIDKGIELYNLQQENKGLIEKLKIANKQLDIARQKAEESDELKSKFLANISHEVRTPLNALIGISAVVSSENTDEKTKNEFISTLDKNVQRLVSVFDEISYLSKLETYTEPFEISKFDIAGLLNDLKENFIHKITDNFSLKCKFCNIVSENSIVSDRYKLHKLLYNLINNAIKYTDKGYVEFGYKFVQNDDEKNKDIVFYVKDTGRGITEENMDKIFDRFIKIEHKDSYFVGTGLGLTIAKKITELLGGKIYLESELEKGTTFFVQLPYPEAIATDERLNIVKI